MSRAAPQRHNRIVRLLISPASVRPRDSVCTRADRCDEDDELIDLLRQLLALVVLERAQQHDHARSH